MLISDIHLRDYHQYNKTPHQRLESFKLLAKDIVEIGKNNGVDTMLIGGDIVDKNTLSPLELHVLFSMFTTLAKHFRIYSIIGNHDAKSKKDISTSDTVITLLEEIDNITFHHKEILTIGGRTVAFENWMPEYDLSWITTPTDLYLSHATIDYDKTGLYGMDTSVFDGKFTLGIFGDIHVNRQIGNLVSIGNTKQESLSDKHQGGVMIMDLDDLSYKRIPIDPEHKKYLHLSITEEEDEEGWVDLEGESMVYKVFKPKRIKGKAYNFKLPEVTDIEAKTNKVMSEFGLGKLHTKIKEDAVSTAVDFNFKLLDLEIENFRSIRKYKLDFGNDYIIMGANGTGKSSVVQALFYSLIGKKTLKRDIKFGQKFCRLKVRLTYQGVTYEILRGTEKGDFGFTVGNSKMKFNTKLEFERAVVSYLPFLAYHESFFFNSWDTELLGQMKVDRRYDLMAKYYRLDVLSSYNDIAEPKFITKKKTLKEIASKVESLKFLKDSREKDYLDLEEELGKGMSENALDVILREHNEFSTLVRDLNTLNSECYSIQVEIDEKTELINSQKVLLNSLGKTLTTNKTVEEIKYSLDQASQASVLEGRISKGDSYINQLQHTKESNVSKLEVIAEKLKNLGVEKLMEMPEGIEKELAEVKKVIEDLKITRSNEFNTINNQIKDSNSRLNELNSELKVEEEKVGGNDTCECCGQEISHQDLLDKLREYIAAEVIKLNSLNDGYKALETKYSNFEKQLNSFRKKKEGLYSTLNKVNEANELFYKNKSLRESLAVEESEALASIKDSENNLKEFSQMLKDLKTDLAKIPTYTSNEIISLNADLRNLLLIEETSNKLESLKTSVKPKIDSLKRGLRKAEDARDVLQQSLNNQKLISSDEIQSYKDLKYKYNTLKDLNKRFLECSKELSSEKKKYDKLKLEVEELEVYCDLTSRSGSILKSVLDDLTKTLSSSNFRFTTAKVQASGKTVTDLSLEFLVDKTWIPYISLSSGQKTVCDLYYISKVVTGVGVICLDETLRFLDDEYVKQSVEIIDSMKKNNLLMASHKANLSMEGTVTLECSRLQNTTIFTPIV